MNKNCKPNIIVPDKYSVVVVQNIAERNDIPCKLRQDGMIAIVVEENYIQYQLKVLDSGTSFCDNSNWKILASEDTLYIKGDPGPKGDPFTFEDFTFEQLELLKGPRGLKGDKGDPFKYEDFTLEQLKALRGPRGNDFKYSDFTREQLEALKGPKGDKGDKGDKGENFKYEDFTDAQLESLKGEPGDKGEPGKSILAIKVSTKAEATAMSAVNPNNIYYW